jgi:predicted DNA-binding transcriptional regulator AlpA
MLTSAAHNDPPSAPSRRLIDSKEVGRLLGCSWRTVLRHADAGRIPWGIKLGALRRWDAVEIEAFIANECRMSSRNRGGPKAER